MRRGSCHQVTYAFAVDGRARGGGLLVSVLRVMNPTAYPMGAHFSPPIGATHNSSVTFWESGGNATAGTEDTLDFG